MSDVAATFKGSQQPHGALFGTAQPQRRFTAVGARSSPASNVVAMSGIRKAHRSPSRQFSRKAHTLREVSEDSSLIKFTS